MSMKDGKREYQVVWIQHGMRYVRKFYTEYRARELTYILMEDDNVPKRDIQIVHQP